jgi:hypothetical protein
MRSPCCLCVCVFPPVNFWMPEPIFMKLGIYIVARESISTADFINPFRQCACPFVYPPNVVSSSQNFLLISFSEIGSSDFLTMM